MVIMRVLALVVFAAMLLDGPVLAEGNSGTPTQQTEAVKQETDRTKAEADKKDAEAAVAEAQRKAAEAQKKAAEEQKKKDEAEKNKATAYEGSFTTDILGGGSNNDFSAPVQSTRLAGITTTFKWRKPEFAHDKRVCPRNSTDVSYDDDKSWPREGKTYIASRTTDRVDPTKSILAVNIPVPLCWWPFTQLADLKIEAGIEGVQGQKTLFEGTVPIGVFYLPFAITLLAIALIYPGCAVVVYYLRRRRYEQDCAEAKAKNQPVPAEPNVWAVLDPVQISANPYGRASLAKLQIFLFSFIVFGLLLFFLLRYGILAGMSVDVLLLMGISAVGAVGGKMTYTKKRRLDLENWAWLRRKGWLPVGQDVQPRAKWSELFVDADTKEFDPYSFQMAVFSIVVAAALIRTNLAGLGTFRIPGELLALLGLSQVVFIGGKAVEVSGYEDLNKQLREVRAHEAKYLELKDNPDAEKQKEATAELKAFKDSVAQAREMFWAVYVPQLPKKPPALEKAKVDAMVPGATEPEATVT